MKANEKIPGPFGADRTFGKTISRSVDSHQQQQQQQQQLLAGLEPGWSEHPANSIANSHA
jgi:hypothetical protein